MSSGRGAFAAAVCLMVVGPGCAVLVGSVKPVAEKSGSYQVADLAAEDSDWRKLDPAETGPDDSDGVADLDENEMSDVAYQSRRTAAIISLNSSCRKRFEDAKHDLRHHTDMLLLGVANPQEREEGALVIGGRPGLQTTVRGTLDSEPVRIRVVVFRGGRCIYDLMYVARTDRFDGQAPAFDKFVGSLRLQ